MRTARKAFKLLVRIDRCLHRKNICCVSRLYFRAVGDFIHFRRIAKLDWFAYIFNYFKYTLPLFIAICIGLIAYTMTKDLVVRGHSSASIEMDILTFVTSLCSFVAVLLGLVLYRQLLTQQYDTAHFESSLSRGSDLLRLLLESNNLEAAEAKDTLARFNAYCERKKYFHGDRAPDFYKVIYMQGWINRIAATWAWYSYDARNARAFAEFQRYKKYDRSLPPKRNDWVWLVADIGYAMSDDIVAFWRDEVSVFYPPKCVRFIDTVQINWPLVRDRLNIGDMQNES